MTFHFWNWNLQFLHLQKPFFAWSGLEQVSLWWINSNFCVGKGGINLKVPNDTNFFWPTLFHMIPLNFQQILSNPQWNRNGQNASICSFWMRFSISDHCENCIVTQCKFWQFFCCSTLTCSVFQITVKYGNTGCRVSSGE